MTSSKITAASTAFAIFLATPSLARNEDDYRSDTRAYQSDYDRLVDDVIQSARGHGIDKQVDIERLQARERARGNVSGAMAYWLLGIVNKKSINDLDEIERNLKRDAPR